MKYIPWHKILKKNSCHDIAEILPNLSLNSNQINEIHPLMHPMTHNLRGYTNFYPIQKIKTLSCIYNFKLNIHIQLSQIRSAF